MYSSSINDSEMTRNTKNSFYSRKFAIFTSLVILISLSLTGCGLNKLLKPRMPSLYQTDQGVVFIFYSSSAHHVTLAGDDDLILFDLGEFGDDFVCLPRVNKGSLDLGDLVGPSEDSP